MRLILGFVAVVVIAATPACREDGWNPSAPFAPSLRPAFGARLTDGQLRIWTGSKCLHVTRAFFWFEPNWAKLELTAPKGGIDADYFTVGGPYPGMTVDKPLPDGFDWRHYETLQFFVDAASGGWGSETQLSTVVKESAQHPDDTYWFQDVGWLNPADVAAKDGKIFLATCTPDPKKAKKA